MTGEICMFDKYGFCKEREKCEKTHLTEICVQEECDSKKCDKRHPRPCKYFQQNGYCKYKSNCKYGHKQSGCCKDQNLRIEALEKKNEKLTTLIEDQNEAIRKLKDEIILNETLRINQLEREIKVLRVKCNEKSETIKKLSEDVTFLKDEVDHICDSVFEDYVPLEVTNKENRKYVTNSIEHLEVMEAEIKKCRKNAKDLGVKFNFYCEKLEKEVEVAEKVSNLYTHEVEKLKECTSEHHCEFSNNIDEKIVGDKDDFVKHIEKCKNSFKNLLASTD